MKTLRSRLLNKLMFEHTPEEVFSRLNAMKWELLSDRVATTIYLDVSCNAETVIDKIYNDVEDNFKIELRV